MGPIQYTDPFCGIVLSVHYSSIYTILTNKCTHTPCNVVQFPQY
jgi:hypothetical protein